MPSQSFAMLPNTLIDRVETAIAGVSHTQTPPALAADEQALQQAKALPGRPSENLGVGAISR
jgi:hypothetical protein